MTSHLEIPSKRPFGHPVPLSVLECFCHPRPGHKFHLPAYGRDEKLYCSNGWVTVRFFNFPVSAGPGPQTMVDDLKKLPWHTLYWEEGPDYIGKKDGWRCLDDVRGDIYAEPMMPLWLTEKGGYRTDPRISVDICQEVPVVSLQLVARLPKPEIFVNFGQWGEPVPFRFRGGEGLLWTVAHEDPVRHVGGPPVARIFRSFEKRRV